jgi:LysR family nod box-dependent transcriptional activator
MSFEQFYGYIAMRFKGLDLNLLVVFDVLLEVRSVSKAAERLNLSQPAASAALARLRTYFGDEILVLHGKRMHPTAYAESLLPQVQECLQGVEALIATSTRFDPLVSHRTFNLVASDYITAAVIAPLIRRLTTTAPNVRVEIILPDAQAGAHLDQGRIDMLITPADFILDEHPAELLLEEQHVIAGWKDNPIFGRAITEEDIFACGHVAVRMGGTRTATFGDKQLEILGKRRRVEVTAASFTIVPWLLIETPRLAVMHRRLAKAMAAYFPIAYAEMPFEFPVMREMMQFHRARTTDGALQWLREELRHIASHPSIHIMDAIP